MRMHVSIITKRGDDGQTDLMFGKRLPKNANRIEAYGTVDELNAVLGVVRHSGISQSAIDLIDDVQKRLVGLMGELATLEEDLPKYDEKGYARITADDVSWIETISKQYEHDCDIRFKGWARPGQKGLAGSAHLDWARAVCRRAERRIATLRIDGDLSNEHSAIFINRFSDLLWILARFEELESGQNN